MSIIPYSDTVKMTIIPKSQILLYNPLKIAIFALSKDGRLKRAETVKIEGARPPFNRFVYLKRNLLIIRLMLKLHR